jgi:hypothetical protein
VWRRFPPCVEPRPTLLLEPYSTHGAASDARWAVEMAVESVRPGGRVGIEPSINSIEPLPRTRWSADAEALYADLICAVELAGSGGAAATGWSRPPAAGPAAGTTAEPLGNTETRPSAASASAAAAVAAEASRREHPGRDWRAVPLSIDPSGGVVHGYVCTPSFRACRHCRVEVLELRLS